jgi:hypothetical protein
MTEPKHARNLSGSGAPHQQQRNESAPEQDRAPPSERVTEGQTDKSNYWDKAVVTISTAVIAFFTVVLAIATILLFWSSEKVAEAAKQSADAAAAAFNLIKRPELTTNFDSWTIQHFEVDQSPVIAFEIINAGSSHAHILRARYYYTVARNTPNTFNFHGALEGVPALL